MKKTRYLTKTRFKLALDCPTKLFYCDKEKNYFNKSLEDPFLKALADGGFQVSVLAQCYYPGGIEIETLDYVEAKKQTDELLKNENAVIFEAALQYKNLFVRVDILEKKGNNLKIIEVKSKSIDPNTFEDELWNKNQLKKKIFELKGDWRSYLYDIAFQSHVAKMAFPQSNVTSYLMCADKTKLTSVDGLNEKFLIKKNPDKPDRNIIELIGDVSLAALGDKILTAINVDKIVDIIHNSEEKSYGLGDHTWESMITFLADHYEKDIKIKTPISSNCKNCEFRGIEHGKKSGFNECWKECHGFNDEELSKPFVFDVWNFSGSQKLIEQGIHFMDEITEDKFHIKESDGMGLSSSERQWLQIEKNRNSDLSTYFDKKGLELEMLNWKFPLHMIDFETCMVPIPFNKGRHPYEQIAFQFSHHVIYKDGKIEHKDEYINSTPGFFPNFEFVRFLKVALEKDQGTIFRFSHHENTVLCQIHSQLEFSDEIDKLELQSFIRSITSNKGQWEGERTMVDLCEMVKLYYYNPLTNGSNSIKYVLPAILNESKFIQSKYGQPIYNSKNYKNKTWIEFDSDGKVIDPYKSLDPVFNDYETELVDRIMGNDAIGNGGAALTAYALMQYTQMSNQERDRIRTALLRYCELDTLSMVMIWEHWNYIISVN
jgi:hypothetical protein